MNVLKSLRDYLIAMSVLSALLYGGLALGDTHTPPAITEQQVAQLFDRWNASLQTGDPDTVVANYASNAILLPTVSNKVRHNHAEIKDYFENFLELKPKGVINERNVHIYGDTAIDSGIYTFNLVKEGQPTQVKARYTFVYHKQGDQWLIVEHHSSALPESPEQEIAQLFDRWNASLQTGDPAKVAANYAEDAILLPTVSNRVRHNHEEIKEYFERFLKLKPQGVINERNIRNYGDVAIDSGVYTFTLVKEGQPTQVRARYTFVYHKEGDQWLISEHHSSAMPERIPN